MQFFSLNNKNLDSNFLINKAQEAMGDYSRADFLKLAFQIHDFNNNGVIDACDVYELLYISKAIRTKADYLLLKDALPL